MVEPSDWVFLIGEAEMEPSIYSRFIIGQIKCGFIISIGIGLSLCAFAGMAGGSSGDRERNADQFVREVMENEIKAQKDDMSLWQYQENKSENGKEEIFEVVETAQGDLQQLVAVNGQTLGPEQQKKEEARIQHLLTDRQAFRNERRKQEDDVRQELTLLHMLANAFHYEDAGQDGELRKVDFTPNPSFHPPSREGEVFYHMSGTLWLNVEQQRLARMSGRLTSEVNFGWGILGHLAKGGTFDVEQSEVAKGRWELTRLDVNMNGKALFFKTIDVKQKLCNSNFKPVPPEITLEEAAQMLKRDSTVSAREESGY